jgi:hypothetical protein
VSANAAEVIHSAHFQHWGFPKSFISDPDPYSGTDVPGSVMQSNSKPKEGV